MARFDEVVHSVCCTRSSCCEILKSLSRCSLFGRLRRQLVSRHKALKCGNSDFASSLHASYTSINTSQHCKVTRLDQTRAPSQASRTAVHRHIDEASSLRDQGDGGGVVQRRWIAARAARWWTAGRCRSWSTVLLCSQAFYASFSGHGDAVCGEGESESSGLWMEAGR